MKLKIIYTAIGYLLASLGLTLMLQSNVAMNPPDVLFNIVAKLLGSDVQSVGMIAFQGLIAIVLIILIFTTNIETNLKTVILGFFGIAVISGLLYLFNDVIFMGIVYTDRVFSEEFGWLVRVPIFLVGVIMLSSGIYLFATQQLVTPPYDLFTVTFAPVVGISFGTFRIIFDFFVMILAIIGFVTIGSDLALNIGSIILGLSFGQTFKIYAKIPFLNMKE